MRLRATRTLLVEPDLPAPLASLRRLSWNLYWTWNTDAAALFERLGRQRWTESGHNPVRVLQAVSPAELEAFAGDTGFVAHLDRVTAAFDAYLARPPQVRVAGTSARSVIAYFSLEFALTESLPDYSGGLGVLAGDHLKSASDLGLPLVGVGLLYKQGYFHQVLGPDGWQTEEYQEIDLASQPISRVTNREGEPLHVPVPMDGREVRLAVWRLDVGLTPLYLLDADVDGNSPEDRATSARLYGGDIETRIQQEMLLGIGGVRALHALDIHPAVCHMNEGHSALLGPDRIRMLMEETGATFDEARLPVAAATVFTTHTAVAAGIDLFPPDLVRKYLGPYYQAMGLDDRAFLGLGRINPDDSQEPFSMALLGLRLSGYRNGVSQLHGGVSRQLWGDAWRNLPAAEVPIDAITNGVHLPTWVAHDVGELYDQYVGPEWRDNPSQGGVWAGIQNMPDDALWRAHERQRERLVLRAREQHRASAEHQGLAVLDLSGGEVLDPRTLTIGFARRFAGYKRATLLFRDPERLARILNNPARPLQIVFAGKAHPRDEPGKQLIREVVAHSRRPEFRDRLVVLEGYDVELARVLVQGCDVWLNTPLRPLEASGTSGMKAVANGALHMSVLDGWWREAYRPGLGWAVGRDRIEDDPEVQDLFDAASLYDLLEQEVAPLFYERNVDGVPARWVERMKDSVAAFAPYFSTHRMVEEYTRRAYGPAARTWVQLRSNNMKPARDLAGWLARLRSAWDTIRIVAVADDARGTTIVRKPISVTAQVHLGPLSPEDVRVDVVSGGAGPEGELQAAGTTVMAYQGMDETGICRYLGSFEPDRGGRVGYTVRILPAHPDLHNPLDTGLVRWA
ncbi:MAG: alpha-glucan family phosphorylase [Dehalococcoidia bacterium]|nr:alpha-glucan family phosphorylase [Dehalococcoidia bacterium]